MWDSAAASHHLFTENEQSSTFYAQTVVNKQETKGPAGIAPQGRCEAVPLALPL